MSKKYLALQLFQRPTVTLGGHPVAINLPPGCVGITFVFKSKKAARDWCHKKVELQELTTEEVE